MPKVISKKAPEKKRDTWLYSTAKKTVKNKPKKINKNTSNSKNKPKSNNKKGKTSKKKNQGNVAYYVARQAGIIDKAKGKKGKSNKGNNTKNKNKDRKTGSKKTRRKKPCTVN